MAKRNMVNAKKMSSKTSGENPLKKRSSRRGADAGGMAMDGTTGKFEGARSSFPGSGASASSNASSGSSSRDYKEIIKDLAGNPAVRYVAAGLATAILTRVANNLHEKYPEISDFIKDNLDKVEGSVGGFEAGPRH